MPKTFFIFNGINSLNYGIRLETSVDAYRAEERVQKVTIPGRGGSLTLTQGDDIYEPYTVTVKMAIPTQYKADVIKWLRGSGAITFYEDVAKEQECRVIDMIELGKASKNLEWWNCSAAFYCQPYKRLRSEARQTLSAGSNTVMNAGDVEAMPSYIITAGNTDFTIAVGDYSLSVAASSASTLATGQKWLIDTESAEVSIINANEIVSSIQTALCTGTFPRLAVGTNAVVLSTGATGQLIKNQRYL